MNLQHRIQAFASLGNDLKALTPEQIQELALRAGNANPWFDKQNVTSALNGIISQLDKQYLQEWLFVYDLDKISVKKVGVVMAGNKPLAGFPDFLSVLITGHLLYAKLSSEDTFLMKMLAQRLIELEPQFAARIHFVPVLKDVDAVIATSNDQTALNLERYFSNKPHLIRKTRHGLGILTGEETPAQLKNLGQDILSYYGLSSRSVSKVLVPTGYIFNSFFEAIEPYHNILDHHRYQNNYDYNKSLLLVNLAPHFDNGFLLITPDEGFTSPISVLFYQEYSSPTALKEIIEANQEKIQCLVSADGWYEKSIAFGQTQYPALWDYAAGVDTIAFLAGL